MSKAGPKAPRSQSSVLEHALRVLEFQQVLERVAVGATSAAGRDAVRELRPTSDATIVRAELALVAELRDRLAEAPGWVLPEIPEIADPLDRVGAGGTLDPLELHGVGLLLLAAEEVGAFVRESSSDLPGLAGAMMELHEDADMRRGIESCVDDSGSVLDGASRALRDLRRDLRGRRKAIVDRLESVLRGLPDRIRVPDGSVTLREGRYCIPIRREGRKTVGGIVHDESASGATLFVEPPLAIRMGGELRSLEREEAREVARILREWSGRVRSVAPELMRSLTALIRFDSLRARAVTARRWGAHPPAILDGDSGDFEIAEGRHPLLIEDGVDVVPFWLRMKSHERILVVSGPNTGGKTVLLKALGLIPALAQSGILPPVGEGTSLPVFDAILADIGDEQSIAESLSTFSAHLTNLVEIVARARPGTLALVDELGTGTDPAEGGPLARAIVEALAASGGRAVVTSHLGMLKELDTGEGSAVVNGSLQFDRGIDGPTYAFVKGRPGRSYGLAIARRLGFPAGLLARAEALRGPGEADLEDLLARTAEKERALDRRLAELEERERRVTETLAEVETRDRELRERERDAERVAKEEARELLLASRREVEAAIEELRQTLAAATGELDGAAGAARARVERAARELRDVEPRPGSGDRPVPEGPPLEPGDRVRVSGGGTRGVIESLEGARARVAVGGLRLEVPVADLERVGPAPAPEEAARPTQAPEGGWSAVVGETGLEADLRGLRVDELDLALGRALDRAILGGLTELRVVHGKGTGALRQRVEEVLREDPRVREHRLGGPGEGGTGVTVVTFR